MIYRNRSPDPHGWFETAQSEPPSMHNARWLCLCGLAWGNLLHLPDISKPFFLPGDSDHVWHWSAVRAWMLSLSLPCSMASSPLPLLLSPSSPPLLLSADYLTVLGREKINGFPPYLCLSSLFSLSHSLHICLSRSLFIALVLSFLSLRSCPLPSVILCSTTWLHFVVIS